MRIRMVTTESGRYPGFFNKDTNQYHCLVGHEYDVPDALASAWVAQGFAVQVKVTKAKE